MADKDRKDKIVPPRGPRPNYQMWIILGLVVVILAVTQFYRAGDLVEVKSSRFEDMAQRRDIKKLVLIKNQELVEITLKTEALQNAAYRQELEKNSPLGLNSNGPHYKLKISSIDKFIDKYDELNKGIPKDQQIDIQVENFLPSSPL